MGIAIKSSLSHRRLTDRANWFIYWSNPRRQQIQDVLVSKGGLRGSSRLERLVVTIDLVATGKARPRWFHAGRIWLYAGRDRFFVHEGQQRPRVRSGYKLS